MKRSFGYRLRVVRNEKKKTQSFMAAQVGVNASTWNRWESDQMMPGLGDLEMIAVKFSVSLDWLIMGIDTHAGVAAHILFMLDRLRPRDAEKLKEWLEVRLEASFRKG